MFRAVFDYPIIFLIIFCGIIGATLQCTPSKELGKEVNQAQGGDYVPGEVLVRFGEDITKEEISKIADRLSMKFIKTISAPDYVIYRFKLPDGLKVIAAIKRLEKIPEIEHAQPNTIKKLY